MLKKYNWLWLDLALLVVLFISSSMPYYDQSLVPELNAWLPPHFTWAFLNHIDFYWASQHVSVQAMGMAGFTEFFIRKLAHFSIFFVLGGAAILGLRTFTQPTWLRVLLAWLACAGVAALDEFHQMLTQDRTPLFQDVLLDATGALIGIALVSLVLALWRRRRRVRTR